jgi:ferredoxin-like protein FixX
VFKINNIKNIENLATIKIIDGVTLHEFLGGCTKTKFTTLCPTNAIDIKEYLITKDCVECGICWIKFPQNIEFERPDFDKFLSYCDKNKLFVYKWLSLILQDTSGINIKVPGYSRDKRIPLIILDEGVIYIVKIARTVKEIDYENVDLDEIESIIISIYPKLDIRHVIVLIKETKLDLDYLNQFQKTHILSLKRIHDNVLSNNISNLKSHLERSNFNGISDK